MTRTEQRILALAEEAKKNREVSFGTTCTMYIGRQEAFLEALEIVRDEQTKLDGRVDAFLNRSLNELG